MADAPVTATCPVMECPEVTIAACVMPKLELPEIKTCPEVKVKACEKQPRCDPPPPIHEIKYIGPIPHWCEGEVCNGQEAAGFIAMIIVCLGVFIGFKAAWTAIVNYFRSASYSNRKADADLETNRIKALREDARDKIKIDRERADDLHAVKLREDQRILAQKKAEFEIMSGGFHTSPDKKD